MKRYKLILFIVLSVLSLDVFSQIEYGYDIPESSKDPWKFGFSCRATYDWVNQNNGIDKKIGVIAGITGEKHLVYNVYFRPALNFWNKGYKCRIENNFATDVNAYLLELELNIELKFGSDAKQRGLALYFAPFFTYGIAGSSSVTSLNPAEQNYGLTQTYTTFADNNIKKEDVGFILGFGYDINKHIELNFDYVLGYFNIGSYNNFRWRSLQAGLTYFL